MIVPQKTSCVKAAYHVDPLFGRTVELVEDGDDRVLVVRREEAQTVGAEDEVINLPLGVLRAESVPVEVTDLGHLEDDQLLTRSLRIPRPD